MHVDEYRHDPGDWDRFVRAQDDWTPFHLFGWKRLIESVFGHECVYLAASDPSGRLVGVLPLVEVRSPIFGRYLVSMPFVNYGGPVGPGDAAHALVETAMILADRKKVDLLELRSRQPFDISLPASHRRITVVLDLPPGAPDDLWKGFPAKVRSQVRRPMKENFELRFGPDQLAPFFAVYARHMRDLGTPTQSKRLFEGIAREFGDAVWFGCVYDGAKPVAGGCGFQWDSEFEMTWAASLRDYNRVAPNMLLYWGFMERAARQELALFNFGRCAPDSGTHRFKRQWGGRDVELYWYQKSRGEVSGTPSPRDAKYALGPRVWRYLPVSLANWLGPMIVRYIP